MPHYVVFICIYYYKSHRTHIINIQPSLELFFKNTTVWLMARLSFWPCNSPPQRFNHMYPNVSMWVSNIGYPYWLAKKKRTHICFFFPDFQSMSILATAAHSCVLLICEIWFMTKQIKHLASENRVLQNLMLKSTHWQTHMPNIKLFIHPNIFQ